ncbi:MAG: hypothetical protein ABL918_00135 [Chakrabartia sp.]
MSTLRQNIAWISANRTYIITTRRMISGDEVALQVEVVVNFGMDQRELLERFRPPKSQHRSLCDIEASNEQPLLLI